VSRLPCVADADEGDTMKITKQRLKEIIKEELSDTVLLSEGVWEEWFKIKEQYPHLWQSAASAIAFAIEEVPGQKSIKRPQAGKYAPKWAQAKVGQVPTPLSPEWDQLSIPVKRAATVALEKWLKEEAPDLLHSLAQDKKAGEDPGWKEEEDFFSRGGTRDPEQRQAVRESNTKITKQRLKEIIKEELANVLQEPEVVEEPVEEPAEVPVEEPVEEPLAAAPAEVEIADKSNLVALLRDRAMEWVSDPEVQVPEVQIWMSYSDRLMRLAKHANLASAQYGEDGILDQAFKRLESMMPADRVEEPEE